MEYEVIGKFFKKQKSDFHQQERKNPPGDLLGRVIKTIDVISME
jgi:hypothetical protein